MNFKEPQGQMARRIEPVRNGNAASAGKETYECGCLVKGPCEGGKPCTEFSLRVKLQDLPCGGCPYCTRAQSNWSGFDPEVDDVVDDTPNMMMLGREISLPAELMFGSPGKTGQPEGDQYVGKLQTAIEGAHSVARETETGTETNEEGLRRKSKGQGIKSGGFGVPIGHCHH